MTADIRKKDIRTVKTKRFINAAMFALLERQSFKKLTIKDICEEALISRATFYSHFMDKYDLLKYWMENLELNKFDESDTREEMEETLNKFVSNNKAVIKNVMEDADYETIDIVLEFILSMLGEAGESAEERQSQKSIVCSIFFAGGIFNYLLWHVRNRFPFDVMNIYIYDIIERFRKI